MIAAGSLFTSCVTNTEPQGIKDLREAKADYLASLSKLREADAEKVKAEATLVQAQAATEQARAALVQAKAKAEEIQNEYDAEHNAITIAQEQANAEAAIKAAEFTLKNNEILLAQAEEALRQALVKIELEVNGLTQSEKDAISAYTTAYNKVLAKQAAVKRAEADLYAVTYNEYGENSVDAAKAGYEAQIAIAEKSKAYFEAAIAENQEMTKTQIASYEEWVKKYDALQAENAGFAYDKAQIVKDSSLNDLENKAALDSFYTAIEAKEKDINNAKAKFELAKNSVLPVLKFTEGNVEKTFAWAVNEFRQTGIQVVDPETDKADTLKVKFTDPKVAQAYVDSLNFIIDALQRDGVVIDQLVKDTVGLGALVAKTQHDHDSIKAALVAGVDAFEEIAKAQAKLDSLNDVATKVNNQFKTDSAAFVKSIKDFISAWNKYAKFDQSKTDADDSLAVFNAFKSLMSAREKVFSDYTGDLLKYDYYKPYLKSFDEIGRSKDTIPYSKLEFSGIKKGAAIYGYTTETGAAVSDPFGYIVNKAFGTEDSFNFSEPDIVEYSDLRTASNLFEKLCCKQCFVNGSGKLTNKTTDGKFVAYESQAVKAAKIAAENAKKPVIDARKAYYKDIYCAFWGINYNAEGFQNKMNDDKTAFGEPADSLKIVYTEETFKGLPVFAGATSIFKASGKSTVPGKIDWAGVSIKDPKKELAVIENQLGKNYLKPVDSLTLYAKTLALAQFDSQVKNYTENTAALKQLAEIVKAVTDAKADADAKVAAGTAKSDSLTVALTGKKSGNPIVARGNVKAFINAYGSFNLAGEQKVLAEKWLADYAKKYAELEKQKKEIDATIADNNALSKIYADYVADLANIEKVLADTTDPDAVYNAILNQFNFVNAMLQSWIEGCEKAIATAEGSIKKLEAGYDPAQLAIEGAKKALDEAKKALEQAEAELAVAEAAYKQVLANHGLTE